MINKTDLIWFKYCFLIKYLGAIIAIFKVKLIYTRCRWSWCISLCYIQSIVFLIERWVEYVWIVKTSVCFIMIVQCFYSTDLFKMTDNFKTIYFSFPSAQKVWNPTIYPHLIYKIAKVNCPRIITKMEIALLLFFEIWFSLFLQQISLIYIFKCIAVCI